MARPMLLRRGACGVLLCAFLVVVPAAGAGTLDQSQPMIGNGAAFASSHVFTAQIFTSGLTGRLDQVDLGVSRPASIVTVPLTVQIRTVSSGLPSATVLASTTVPATAVAIGFVPGALLPVAIATAPQVTAGVQYAIVLSSADCGFNNCFHWALAGNNPYPAGLALQSVNGGAWVAQGAVVNADVAFQTFVAQAPTSKAQCKKGGWRTFTNPKFKNQGRCIAYVNHHNAKGQDDSKAAAGNKGKGKGKKPK